MVLKDTITIGFYSGESSAVRIAINNLKRDIGNIIACDVRMIENTERADIVIVTKDVYRLNLPMSSQEEKILHT